MKRLARWMTRLYPPAWRARYGSELDALVAERGADARVVTDLFKQGIRMQFSTWSFPKLAFALGIGGMLFGLSGSVLPKSMYSSQAILRMTPSVMQEGTPNFSALRNQLYENVLQLQVQVLSRTALSKIIDKPELQLYRDRIEANPQYDAVGEMRQDIRVEFIAPPGGVLKPEAKFSISFACSDGAKARQVVRELVDAFSKLPIEQARLELLSEPSPPAGPYRFRRDGFRAPVLGLFAGLLCAGVIAMIHGGRNRPSLTLFAPNATGTL